MFFEALEIPLKHLGHLQTANGDQVESRLRTKIYLAVTVIGTVT